MVKIKYMARFVMLKLYNHHCFIVFIFFTWERQNQRKLN